MRILFDSKKEEFKSPFGTLTPGQECHLSIYVPESVGAKSVLCMLSHEDGTPAQEVTMTRQDAKGVYDVFRGSFTLPDTGLYFYYFRVFKASGSFRLYKQGDDTNMEEGELWQVSCIPASFTTPDWAKGAVIYQVFPDRFYIIRELVCCYVVFLVFVSWD